MLFTSKVVALLSVLSSTAFATDVYSAFLDESGAEIGTTNFDVGNPGCFSVSDAVEVRFTQGGGTHTANGPYCLSGFSLSGCSGTQTSQEFRNVALNGGQTYSLMNGVSAVTSYHWVADSC